MSRTTRSIVVTLVVLVIVAALGFVYASPYIALDRVKRAADARDAQTVNEYVDFPALRASLKDQIAALLTRRVDIQKSGNPLAIIGAMIGAALVGPLVDSYATPDGVAAILNGIRRAAIRASVRRKLATAHQRMRGMGPRPASRPHGSRRKSHRRRRRVIEA